MHLFDQVDGSTTRLPSLALRHLGWMGKTYPKLNKRFQGSEDLHFLGAGRGGSDTLSPGSASRPIMQPSISFVQSRKDLGQDLGGSLCMGPVKENWASVQLRHGNPAFGGPLHPTTLRGPGAQVQWKSFRSPEGCKPSSDMDPAIWC